MRKKVVSLFLFAFFLCLSTSPVFALRARTRKAKKTTSSVAARVSTGVRAQVRFRPDRQGLLMTFSGFENVESVTYELVYNANGRPQGVAGAINAGDTETKNLYFGTCSAGVCTPHRGITDARLSIKSILKDGKVVLKPYRIKV